MIDWAELTLFIYIFARMTGFVAFNPILGRSGIPAMFKAGFIMMLSIFVISMIDQPVEVRVPGTVIELGLRILLEMGIGFLLGMVMNFFFFIPQMAGTMVDNQMGMSMAQTYDPGSQASLSSTGRLLNVLMTMLFFAANGHLTLMRMLLTSGQLVPFGEAALTSKAASAMLAIFVECAVLSLKMSMPILAAELIGQVGMGVLMKVIPQINVFAINIELKVIVGMVMLLALVAPFGEFLITAEANMLTKMEEILSLTGAG